MITNIAGTEQFHPNKIRHILSTSKVQHHVIGKHQRQDQESTIEDEVVIPPVRKGDWQSYLAANQIKGHGIEFRRDLCRDYLGDKMRAVPKSSVVFTPEVLVKLADENDARRAQKYPYFHRIATLWKEIEMLEQQGQV